MAKDSSLSYTKNEDQKTSCRLEKIFANCISDKGLISKAFSKLNGKRQTIQLDKGQNMKRHFTEGKSAHKNMFHIIVITEMHIKATVRCYHTPTRIARRKTTVTAPNAGKDVDKLHLL